MLTGAQIMCEALIREDQRIIFGIPGGAIMPFYNALYGYRDRLHHVLCRHEQGAGHAAEGYARASGRVGVCVATSGPGATNLVTPIADAWMDSTPLVAITGQVSSALLGTDAFQETDITGITIPITKHSYLVRDPCDIPRVFREAFHIASSGRPGPVLIDVTKDAQQARAEPQWEDGTPTTLDAYAPAYDGDLAAVRKAVALLMHAHMPLILAGNGVIQSGATDELRHFAELAHIPVITTLHGKGALSEDHPLSLGMPGMHGWVHVNRAIQQCDVLFNIGGRFDDRVTGKASTFAPKATVIHVDIDPSEIGKNVRVNVGIVGDAKRVLAAMLEELRDNGPNCGLSGGPNYGPNGGPDCGRNGAGNPPAVMSAFTSEVGSAVRSVITSEVGSVVTSDVGSAVRREWLAQIRALQARHQPHQAYMRRPNTHHLMPHDVYAALNGFLGDCREGYRVVTDVGQHQMWAAQLIDWRHPRSHITSGGAGTMGFAVPAALGAALACPTETIWVIVGDGGFQMTNQELATIRQENVRNVKVCIINNGYLGMVRQWQELFENRVYSSTPLSGPCFGQLAEAYGIRGITVERAGDVVAAFEYAKEYDNSVVIDFRVEQEANVFPIVPQGKSIGEMITA